MYLPKFFAEDESTVLHEFIRAHPLAALVTFDAGELCANHIPMLIEPADAGQYVVRGHVARTNPLWRSLTENPDALAIFQDQGLYITPSWYPSKRETGRVVPTWNYAAVHVNGRARAIDDAQWLRQFLERLTAANESSRAQPWYISDAPSDHIERQLKAIVGIEMTVVRIAGKFKVSQNRTDADAAGVVSGLTERGTPADLNMAAMIAERRPTK